MARYPEIPMAYDIKNEEVQQAYDELSRWAATLTLELDTRDAQVDNTPSTNIYSVVTVSNIGAPRAGDIAYSASTGKFKGYVSTGATQAWENLN